MKDTESPLELLLNLRSFFLSKPWIQLSSQILIVTRAHLSDQPFLEDFPSMQECLPCHFTSLLSRGCEEAPNGKIFPFSYSITQRIWACQQPPSMFSSFIKQGQIKPRKPTPTLPLLVDCVCQWNLRYVSCHLLACIAWSILVLTILKYCATLTALGGHA